MKCKICGQKTFIFGNGTYYLADGKHYLTTFFYCRNCNSFIREVDNNSIFSHLKAASHTNLKNEERFYRERIKFFKYIYSLTTSHKSSISNWLDFGCSYGHLIEFLKEKNIDSDGIEISEVARHYAQKQRTNYF